MTGLESNSKAGSGWLTPEDLHHWDQGGFSGAYEKLGGHVQQEGTWFAVWAPNADAVSVLGDFNAWEPEAHPLHRLENGCWQVFVRSAEAGQRYKYRVRNGPYSADKTDPFAFRLEPPAMGGSSVRGLSSILDPLRYTWHDENWMANRTGPGSLQAPVSIYEIHLGSWRHRSGAASLSYRDIAEPLADHLTKLGFTHVELLPVAEHAYYGSWGYQVVGYFAPTYRYGAPKDLMHLIDTLHQRGIGVIIDWVPAHFATDPQGLVYFDGSTLFEYDDPNLRRHPDWGTYIFDYNKPGVRSFLISNSLFWLDKYHVDGLRVDAVASMLYRDYSRQDWTPNRFGGRENLEAIDLIGKTNEAVYTSFPGAIMIAEESTAFPGVSAPTYDEGLGFLYKWNMGWMNDLLAFMQEDPPHRKVHHNKLTFSFMYAFSEHFVLPFSHDEVVHGKGSLWSRMPGDKWQKAANLRMLFGHQYGHPGKKLLFMGNEFGQPAEWNHDTELNWTLLENPLHAGLMQWVQDLNAMYRESRPLWNDTAEGWAWGAEHVEDGVLVYQRRADQHTLIVALNLTATPRKEYRIGVPLEGCWSERLNSDAAHYGGSGMRNKEPLETGPIPHHNQDVSIVLTLPPLAAVFLQHRA